MDDVCTIIVTLNRLEVLKTALSHILAQTQPPASIVIVDNNSNDGTVEFLESLNGRDSTYCLFLESNIGYAGGIAEGIRYAKGIDSYEYFWIMDDDSFYKENTLADLLMSIK